MKLSAFSDQPSVRTWNRVFLILAVLGCLTIPTSGQTVPERLDLLESHLSASLQIALKDKRIKSKPIAASREARALACAVAHNYKSQLPFDAVKTENDPLPNIVRFWTEHRDDLPKRFSLGAWPLSVVTGDSTYLIAISFQRSPAGRWFQRHFTENWDEAWKNQIPHECHALLK